MQNLRTFLIILITSIGLAACGGNKAVEEDITVETVEGNAGDGASTSGLAGDGSSSTSGLDDATNQLLNSRVIYFEYDSSALTLESEAIVQAHAQYLASAQGVGLILEGHADERGTREYNLALGQRRADAVRAYLIDLGVDGSRLTTISYGEEKPFSMGSTESAWAKNRRVHFNTSGR